MAEPISIQQLKDASEDAITLADFIYKPANVMIPRRLAADINSLQYYLDYMSSYAQHSYETYDEMVANAPNLPNGVSAFVTNDLDTAKNGIYTYNGTSFVKGDYQPEKAAKDYVEAKLGGLEVFDGKVRAQDVSTETLNVTQDSINRGLNSVSELMSIPSPKIGLRAYVKSYHAGLNKGGGEYVYTGLEPLVNNGVNKLNGWVRSSPLDIFSGGIKADGSDDTTAFQRTYEVFSDKNQALDLKGLTIHISKLDLISNSSIVNGQLDLRSYVAPVGWENNWRRSPIMSKATPRESVDDYEYSNKYTPLEWLSDVFFRDITFYSNWYISTLYKCKNMDWVRCKFFVSEGSCIQYVGGYFGTTIPDDGDGEFNLVDDTFNPRVRNIRIIDCVAEYTGEITATKYNYSSLCRFIACEDSLIQNCNTVDMLISLHVDIYNRRIDITGGHFRFTERAHTFLTANGLKDGDVLGIYMGQNSHTYNISNVVMTDVQRPLYIEGASKVNIMGCNFVNKLSFIDDTYGVLVQSNLRSPDRVKWANCKDIVVQGNTIVGYDYGVSITPSTTTFLIANKNIKVMGNSIDSGGLSAITVVRTDDVDISNNTCIGSLAIYGVNKHSITNNSFETVDNLALIVDLFHDLYLYNNTFKVSTGSLIRFMGSDKAVYLYGGLVSNSPLLEGDFPLQAVGYNIIGQAPMQINKQLDVASGKSSYWVAYENMNSFWVVNLVMQSEHVYRSEYGWDFDYFAVSGTGGFWLYFVNNMPSTPMQFPAVFFASVEPKYFTV